MSLKVESVKKTDINKGKTLTDIQEALSQAKMSVKDASSAHNIQRNATIVLAAGTGAVTLLNIWGIVQMYRSNEFDPNFILTLLALCLLGYMSVTFIKDCKNTKKQYQAAKAQYDELKQKAIEYEEQVPVCK